MKEAVKQKKKKGSSSHVIGSNNKVGAAREQLTKKEAWSAEFAQHFARHVKPSLPRIKGVSEKEVIAFCQQNVKVEVLRRSDGAELKLYWEDTE